MSPTARFSVLLLVAMSSLAGSGTPAAEENNGTATHPRTESQSADRLIVRWNAKSHLSSASRSQKLTSQGVTGARRSLDADTDIVELPQRLAGEALAARLKSLQSDPDVVYASPDLRRHIHAVTNDPLFDSQWYLSSAQAAATRTDAAWDITTGSPAVIVAVLDTGVRFDHPELGREASGGKVLPGYDFVSNSTYANDGNGRDNDPSDPGDWVDDADRATSTFSDCDRTSSSWHGTRVAGLIGAMTNNAAGVSGAAFDTHILPVRVLGKCGGFDSDIIAGMRWAAGLSVSGVPGNPTPASVINLSLGGTGACTAAYQSAVNDILARGVVIVASAGNEGGPVDAPANCTGVMGIGGIRHIGTKVGFSNLGNEVALSAPGGNCVNTGAGQPCLFSIVVPLDSGTTVPAGPTYSDQLNYNVGTSFSAPQVAAAAALIRSVNSHLDPGKISTLMRRTASAFPVSSDTSIPTCHVPTDSSDLQASECNCTTSTCGAGMLNAAAAVTAAQQPFAVLTTSGTVESGATLTVSASESVASDGKTLTGFQWSVSDVTGAMPVIASPSEIATSLQIPGTSEFTLHLTVTDDHGGQDSVQTQLATPVAPSAPSTPSTPSTSAGSGGGGGGAMGWELLILALLWRAAKAARTISAARAANAP